MKRRRLANVESLKRRQRAAAEAYRPNAAAARRARGGSDQYPEPSNQFPVWVVQPFEVAPRRPAEWFNYGAETTINNGAAPAIILTFGVPAHLEGTIKKLTLYSTLPGGIADLTEFEIAVDGDARRGLLVPAAAPAVAILPDAAFEAPEWDYNLPIHSEQTITVLMGRAAGVDPNPYTYRVRVRGWWWPRRRSQGF